ncbi:MAG: PDZ domain-containing protein [Deltaproteobacteria bacterium]
MAVHVANALITTGKVVRGWLGVSIQEVSPDKAQSLGLPSPEGALVAGVMKGSPADEAGIEKGDVILEYGGQKVSDAAALRNMVAGTSPGKEEKLELWRQKKSMDVMVKIGNLEELAKKLAATLKDRLGAEVTPVTEEEAKQYGLPAPEGVQIESVEPNGPLGKAGFEKGDLILAINKTPVPSVDAFVSMINSLPHHQKVPLLALDHRTGNTGYVEVEVN